jgi:hypothetical protein
VRVQAKSQMRTQYTSIKSQLHPFFCVLILRKAICYRLKKQKKPNGFNLMEMITENFPRQVDATFLLDARPTSKKLCGKRNYCRVYQAAQNLMIHAAVKEITVRHHPLFHCPGAAAADI